MGSRTRCFFVVPKNRISGVAKVGGEIANMRRDMRLLGREAIEIVPLQPVSYTHLTLPTIYSV